MLARWVIHAVGPVGRRGTDNEDATLAACYRSSLALAREVRRLPVDQHRDLRLPDPPRGARVSLTAIRDALEGNETIEEVTLVCFNDANYEAYAELLSPKG